MQKEMSNLMTFPQIWVESVCDDSSDEEDRPAKTCPASRTLPSRLMSLGSTDVSFESSSLSPVSTRQNSLQLASRENSVDEAKDEITIRDKITDWLEKMQAHGFLYDHPKSAIVTKNTSDNQDRRSLFAEGVVRVFDPYTVLSSCQIEKIDGAAQNELPSGLCTVKLKNGDCMVGVFRQGVRQGRGAVEGANMLKHGLVTIRGYYKDGILNGEGRAILAPGSWEGLMHKVTLEGLFIDGFLEGQVRGLDDKGNLVFVGSYVQGVAQGPCWLAREGQGWLYGVVDKFGHFSGDDVTFIYPDLSTCLNGKFENERMVAGMATRISEVFLNDQCILVLNTATPKPGSAILTYSPSTKDLIPCDWNQEDTYESLTVVCKPSEVDGAGDGLFAARDLPTDTIVSYYNGLRIEPGERYNSNSFSYQIYVEWSNTDNSPFVDVPSECIDISAYRASLGHKANHSFMPNCRFVAVEHPRFGRIPALKTIEPVKQGEELFSHYKYDIALAPSWYQKAWNRFNENSSSSDTEG